LIPPDRPEYPDIFPDFPEYLEKYSETPDLHLTAVKMFVIFTFDYSPPSSRHLDPFTHETVRFVSFFLFSCLSRRDDSAAVSSFPYLSHGRRTSKTGEAATGPWLRWREVF
jgi:hypothetical protein